jgi:hypothetical protein
MILVTVSVQVTRFSTVSVHVGRLAILLLGSNANQDGVTVSSM